MIYDMFTCEMMHNVGIKGQWLRYPELKITWSLTH